MERSTAKDMLRQQPKLTSKQLELLLMIDDYPVFDPHTQRQWSNIFGRLAAKGLVCIKEETYQKASCMTWFLTEAGRLLVTQIKLYSQKR